MKELVEISGKEFLDLTKIRFNNILEGLNKFQNKILSCSEEIDFNLIEKRFTNFISLIYKENEYKSIPVIVDFYIKNLTTDEYKNLYNKLNDSDKKLLEKINNTNPQSNYFIVKDKGILDFLVRLSTRELFFVSFYFIHDEITIWGNYDLKFPVFYGEDKLSYIEKHAKEEKLILV